MSATGPLSKAPVIELLSDYASQNEMPPWKVEQYYKDVLAHRGTELDVVSRLDSLMENIRIGKVPRKPLPSFMRSYMASEKILKYAWDVLSEKGGESPGPDGIRYNDLDHRKIWATMRLLSLEIKENQYQRRAERVTYQPKAECGYRPIVLQSILDRTVDKAAALVVGASCEQFFLPMSYGYRPKICAHDALSKALRLAKAEKLNTWLCVDIRDAFSHVPIPRLLDIFKKYFPNKQLLDYIQVLLVDAPVNGLRQGSPLSPVLLNLYLHHHLDKKWAKKTGQRLIRWADDILVMCSTAAEAASAYDQLKEQLKPIGMQIKENKEEAIRHLTSKSPAHWLGFQITKRVTIKAKTRLYHLDIPESAWMKLKENLMQAHAQPNSSVRADESISGWLNYFAPALRLPMRSVIYEQIAQAAKEFGFDEIQPPDQLQEAMKKIWCKWVRLRDRV